MHCPFCGNTKTEVYNSRNTDEKRRIWRRRRCTSCDEAFTTYEASDLSFIRIVKRNDTEEPYRRSKLLISLYHACTGLDEHLEALDGLAGTIEGHLLSLRKQEITTEEIAMVVLDTLKRFHPSPYVRYLSYRGDISSSTELRQLTTKL